MKRHLLILLTLTLGAAAEQSARWPAPQKGAWNPELLKAIRIIEAACDPMGRGPCNRNTIRQLNESVRKEHVLAALRDPELRTLWFFFPDAETDLTQSFNWSCKRPLLDSLKSSNGLEDKVLIVLGWASSTGGGTFNMTLASERMAGLVGYLETLGVRCHAIRGGALGKDALQLTVMDAAALGLPIEDFKNSLVLNQAVAVFAVPASVL